MTISQGYFIHSNHLKWKKADHSRPDSQLTTVNNNTDKPCLSLSTAHYREAAGAITKDLNSHVYKLNVKIRFH